MKKAHVKSAGRTLTYLRLVESYREDGRVKHRIVKHLGRQDQIDPTEIDRLIHSLSPYGTVSVGGQPGLGDTELLPGLEFGSLHALDHVWSELGMPGILTELGSDRRFTFDIANVIKAIVFGRVLNPSSERALITAWLSQVHAPEFEGIELQHAYRALPFLAEVGPELEARVARVLTEKLFADGSLVLFDVTSTYFEGAGPEGLASFGYSRDKRSDRPQVNLALLTSREGFPLSHWVFPGRQADVRSMQEASLEFRSRLGLGSFVVISDRGTISEANLERLRDEGIDYIIAERLRRKTTFEALARAGRYKRVTRNLEVKEVNRDGKDRVILCRNQERAEEDARKRRDILEHLTEQLEEGTWRESLKPTARRYLQVDGGTPSINQKRIKNDARFDGKWVLRTTTSLPPEEVALAYRGLWRIEDAFRTIKTPLELRPIHHTSEAGVRGHVQACVLAYLLTTIIDDRLEKTGIDTNAHNALRELARIQRAPLHQAGLTITKTTTPNQHQKDLLTAIGATIPAKHHAA